jgi:hypothetical protein
LLRLLLTAFYFAHGFRHIFVKVAGRVGVLELDGGMADAELAREELPEALPNQFTF